MRNPGWAGPAAGTALIAVALAVTACGTGSGSSAGGAYGYGNPDHPGHPGRADVPLLRLDRRAEDRDHPGRDGAGQ